MTKKKLTSKTSAKSAKASSTTKATAKSAKASSTTKATAKAPKVNALIDAISAPSNRQRRQTRISTKDFEHENLRPGTIDRKKMISDSRDAEINNPFVSALLKRLENLIIGSGNKIQFSTSDKKADQSLEAWYNKKYSLNCDGRQRDTRFELDANILRRWYVDGDCGVWVDHDAKLYCWEADQMATPTDVDEIMKKGWSCVDGVVIDKRGVPRKFCVNSAASQFPSLGESLVLNPGFFIHVLRARRFRQTRGMSEVVSSLHLLNDLAQYFEAELMSSKANAKWALKVTRKDATSVADMNSGNDTADLTDEAEAGTSSKPDEQGGMTQYTRLEEVAGGAIEYLEPGEDVEAVNQTRPNPEFGNFIRSAIRIFGASHSIPLELVLLDFHEANFFGNRAALMAAWSHVSALQDWFARTVLTPIAKIVLQTADRNKMLPCALPKGWEDGITWTFPELWEIDRGKAENARALALANKSTTLKDECAKQGVDYQERLAQVFIEQKALIDQTIDLEVYRRQKLKAAGLNPIDPETDKVIENDDQTETKSSGSK